MKQLNIVVFGLSITSSWGNGHATTYRSLIKALCARGHQVTFFERDEPWYQNSRDLPRPEFCHTVIYQFFSDLDRHKETIEAADLVIIGSYVKQTTDLVAWISKAHPPCLAFYDIDTPVTVAKLAKGDHEYLHPRVICQFDLYLSFSGGPILELLEEEHGAQRARPLYCSVDPELYFPATHQERQDTDYQAYALGYLGTYSPDRQPTVTELLISPARLLPEQSFCIAGAKYPLGTSWPNNVETIEHIPPPRHRRFYHGQRFTLNVTRKDMVAWGYSPSVRLFEAGACGTPVISDGWEGLETFFDIGREVLVASRRHEVIELLHQTDAVRDAIAENFRRKVLQSHTSEHRAGELESYFLEATGLSADQEYRLKRIS